ncbi:hypothetical protein GWK47_010772 [Chionoecetes opilio]|uniref:Uncharacterized protein n=1 Tax=Chionoecetes opilio TaxID=41210 RepID=A0A8J4XW21_CHIOP|nr:hypothetical protein GWK47_010772 [Chionoecetes opilio]
MCGDCTRDFQSYLRAHQQPSFIVKGLTSSPFSLTTGSCSHCSSSTSSIVSRLRQTFPFKMTRPCVILGRRAVPGRYGRATVFNQEEWTSREVSDDGTAAKRRTVHQTPTISAMPVGRPAPTKTHTHQAAYRDSVGSASTRWIGRSLGARTDSSVGWNAPIGGREALGS